MTQPKRRMEARGIKDHYQQMQLAGQPRFNCQIRGHPNNVHTFSYPSNSRININEIETGPQRIR